ncbi:Zn-dependent metalloprotease [Actinoplanes xinjiangensis]|uniref:Zn-dependent metalloprotease n=2 Tax=Actinoplanes xinjiangensis TaxID=512350 RepID=A0A316F7D3_9ACTN|nr:Zn-dependent metalloprotease [Actinoplanes xinjiangensis]
MTVRRSHARKFIAMVAAAALIGAAAHASVSPPAGASASDTADPAPESPTPSSVGRQDQGRDAQRSPRPVLVGRSVAPAAKPAVVEAAREVVRANRKAVHAVAGEEYEADDVVIDSSGARHVRFDRTWNGLRVLGGDFVVHTTAAGRFAGATVAQDAAVDVSRTPAVAKNDAIATAGKQSPGSAEAQLVVDAHRGEPALAWQVTIAGHLVVVVDATTGRIRRTYDLTKHADTATGHGLHNGEVKLSTTRTAEGAFTLIDPDRGGNTTRDALNSPSGSTPANSRAFIDADDVWGDGTTADRATVGVDVHYGMARTWDYFNDTFGRAGINGDGKGVTAYVHHDVDWANASWNDTCLCMKFGDANGDRKPYTALDDVAHEVTHGLTFRTADLVYAGESGALNEATSDIFGTLVEFAADNPADVPDYLIGEMTAPQPLRWMDEPTRDRRSVSCWSPSIKDLDVHRSSGVANKFFYSLAVGSGATRWGSSSPCGGAAPVTGIGNDAAGAIWYRALATYMVSSTDFVGARQATLQAAADLYGSDSAERSAVQAAWLAVGVDGSGTVPASNTAPVIGPVRFAPAHLGTPVQHQLTGNDPQGQAILWSAEDLPPGLTIAPDGLISGTPTAKGMSTVRIHATDPDGNRTDASAARWYVTGPPTVAGLLPTSQTFNVGAATSFRVNFEDYPDFRLLGQITTVTVETTGLPDGLTATTSVDPDLEWMTRVTVAGTPSTAGTGTIRFTATDPDGETATFDLPYTVGPPLAPATPIAYVYSGEVGGTATVSWFAPATGSPQVTGYVIKVTPGTEQVVPATTRSVALTGLDPAQAYEISVRARGNAIDSAEKILTMKPAQLTLSPSSATVDPGAPVTLTGTVTGPPTLGRLFLEQKAPTAGTWTRVSALTADAAGAWSLTVNPTVTTAYRVSYPAGAIGWWPSSSTTTTVRVGTAGPAGSIVSPSAGARIRGSVKVVFRGSADVASAEVNGVAMQRAGNDWSATVAPSGGRLVVEATDKDGYHSRFTQTVVVDNDGPTATVTPKQNTHVRGTFTTSLTAVSDASGVARAELWANGKYLGAGYTKKVATGHSNGTVKLVWKLTDKLGNTRGYTRTVIADNKAPSLSITAAPGNKAKVKGTVKVAAKASDASGIARIELIVNGKVVATDTTAGYVLSVNTKKQKKTMTVRIRAYDKLGNIAYTSTRTWYRR